MSACFNSRTRSTSCAILFAAATLVAGRARASVYQDYSLTHTVRIAGFNAPGTVSGSTFAQAWIKEQGRNASDVTPSNQPSYFQPFGTTQRFFLSPISNGLADLESFGAVNVNNFSVPLDGIDRVDEASVPAPSSSADAKAEVNVPSRADSTSPVIATLTSSGFSDAVDIGSKKSHAYAYSNAHASYTAPMPNGNLWFTEPVGGRIGRITTTSPGVKPTVDDDSDDPSDRRVSSIEFTTTDPDNNVVNSGVLSSVEMQLFSDGELDWENNSLSLTSSDADFMINLNPQFVTQSGLLDFEVRGGVVTTSTATGVFAGVLPVVGSTGPFNFSLPNEMDFGVNFFGDPLDNETIDINDGSNLPEPASLALLVLPGAMMLRRRR